MKTPKDTQAGSLKRAGSASICKNCKHFGELKGVRGIVRATVCLAPCDDGYRFVYEASPGGVCELWTPAKWSALLAEAEHSKVTPEKAIQLAEDFCKREAWGLDLWREPLTVLAAEVARLHAKGQR